MKDVLRMKTVFKFTWKGYMFSKFGGTVDGKSADDKRTESKLKESVQTKTVEQKPISEKGRCVKKYVEMEVVKEIFEWRVFMEKTRMWHSL
jgi:hypothetical protein